MKDVWKRSRVHQELALNTVVFLEQEWRVFLLYNASILTPHASVLLVQAYASITFITLPTRT